MTIPYRDKFKQFNDLKNQVFSSVVQSRGIQNPRIVIHWSQIVGEDIAKKYRPIKMTSKGDLITLFVAPKSIKERMEFTYFSEQISSFVSRYIGTSVSVKLI